MLNPVGREQIGIGGFVVAVFEIPETRHSSRWGSSGGKWYDVIEPRITIPYFVASAGKYNIIITSEEGIELNNFLVEATEGFNYFEYNVQLTEKGKSAFLKAHKDTEIKKAKNDVLIKLLLAFSGGFLLSIAFIHFIPELYEHTSINIGLQQ